ncbi:MAG: HAMP domain-containing histidine kinase [Lentisphaerae bacterium]|jgi:signal transduction histidine kinase|nr:HAMP domain-containing histidine kinase [Lentisphaerota bacterium]
MPQHFTHRTDSQKRLSLTAQAAIVLLLAAAGAGACLFWLHRSQERLAHIAATRTVLQQGERFSAYFTDSGALTTCTNMTPAAWRLLAAKVDGLHAAVNELAFVSVSHDGETLFHRQLGLNQPSLTSTAPHTVVSTLNIPDGLPGKSRPIMVFSREATHPDGTISTVEIGLDVSAVDISGSSATTLIRALLRLSALAVSLAFGACLVLVVVLVRRDRARRDSARREEHLAFSGVLANGIVHDFRNPMSSVRLDAQMLSREASRPEGARSERITELAGRISRTVERMDQVFREFLFLGKSDHETLEAVDLTTCLHECAETLAPRLETAAVTLNIKEPATPLLVRAAPFALRRAILNLITNAVQFSPRDAVVTITGYTGHNTVSLEIADCGPGIPPRQRERIFDLFVTTRPEGTGLGLFLARAALRKCGGDITAHPRPGGGSIFKVTLQTVKPAPTEVKHG